MSLHHSPAADAPWLLISPAPQVRTWGFFKTDPCRELAMRALVLARAAQVVLETSGMDESGPESSGTHRQRREAPSEVLRRCGFAPSICT